MASRGGTTKTFYKNNKYLVEDNLNFKLTIKPELDGDVVTIYNKRREKFKIDVPAEFEAERIIIDSIDSILYSHSEDEDNPTCLNEERQCCEISDDGASV